MDAAPPTPPPPPSDPAARAASEWAKVAPQDRAAIRLRKGVRVWTDAGDDDGTVARYLKAVGVPELTLPACVRFNPNCEDEWKKIGEGQRSKARGPAIVAALENAAGVVKGTVRIFLDPHRPARRDTDPVKLAGFGGGNAVRIPGREEGPLIVGTDLESVLALHAATGWEARACVDAKRLARWEAGRQELRRCVLVCVGAGEGGQAKALASRLRSVGVRRVVVLEAPGDAGWLGAVRSAGANAARDELHRAAGPDAGRLDSGGDSGAGGGGARDGTGAGDGNLGDGGGGERSSWGGELWWDEEHPSGDGRRVTCLADDPTDRARAFLLRECALRGARRFSLARWGGAWFRHVQGGYVRVEPERLAGVVRQWLHGHWRRRDLKDRVEISPIAPRARDVEEVLQSLAGICYVSCEGMPAWAPPMIGADGRVAWGRGLGAWDPEERSERAEDLLPFRNGLLDLRTLRERREVRMLAHDPELFCGAARPYALDGELLAEGLAGGFEEGDLGARVCPTWTRFLESVCEDDADRRRTLQQMFGDTIGPDRSMEVVYLLCGPTRSGKGVCIAALDAVCGREAIAPITFSLLSGQFGLAPLLGKHVAVMADAHLGHMTDGTAAVEQLKTISGNDPVTVRDLYTPAVVNVRLGARFWIFVNDPPEALRDSSGAFAKRLVVWPFSRSFFGQEDPTFKRNMAREAWGIALWALVGYADLWKSGLPRLESPKSAGDIVADIEEQSSPLLAFLRACCDIGPEFEEDCGTLLEYYSKFLRGQGHQPVRSMRRFRSMLLAHVPRMKRAQRTVGDGEDKRREGVYRGLRLRPDVIGPDLARGLPV